MLFTELASRILSLPSAGTPTVGDSLSAVPKPPPTSLDIMPKSKSGLWHFLFSGGIKAMGEAQSSNDTKFLSSGKSGAGGGVGGWGAGGGGGRG